MGNSQREAIMLPSTRVYKRRVAVAILERPHQTSHLDARLNRSAVDKGRKIGAELGSVFSLVRLGIARKLGSNPALI
jgi:hypothetical protein